MAVEETAEVMRALYEQGRIRAIGVSNLSVAEIERFRRVAPLHVVQSPYNLFERTIDAELLLYCHDNDIVVFGSSPLCRGLLGGCMRPATTFKGDDLRRIDVKFQPPRFALYLNAVRQLDEFAQRRFRRRVVHLAVRWMLDQGIGVALWGGRHPEQLETALGVAGWSLNSVDQMMIERIMKTAIVDPVGPRSLLLCDAPNKVTPHEVDSNVCVLGRGAHHRYSVRRYRVRLDYPATDPRCERGDCSLTVSVH